MPSAHEKRDVDNLALDFIVLANQVAEQLPRGRGHLGDQLERASTSIVLNLPRRTQVLELTASSTIGPNGLLSMPVPFTVPPIAPSIELCTQGVTVGSGGVALVGSAPEPVRFH